MPSGRRQVQGDQYHHFIPQFLLRRFRIITYTNRSCIFVPRPKSDKSTSLLKAKQKRRITATKEGSIPVKSQTILYYDLSTGILETRSLSRAYGETNLYRDLRNVSNLNHIEEKFSRIECQASLIVNHLHGAIASSGKVCYLSRHDHRIFRKFLFLMQHRGDYRWLTCWKEDHSPLRDWVAKRKLEKGLQDDIELWKDCILYYIDKPHQQLVAEGDKTVKQLGGREKMEIMKRTRVDPCINWLAVYYTTIAIDYFMGIWESAEGTEFVLGHNSFGKPEGFTPDGDRIHLIYVLSPRLVVILRSTSFAFPDQHTKLSSIHGTLINIPMKPAAVRFSSFIPSIYSPEGLLEAFEKYRLSDAASEDMYTFTITKLTKSQTQAVNEVVLYNVRDTGSATFSFSGFMLDTLRAYIVSDYHYSLDSNRYDTLLRKLSSLDTKYPVLAQPIPVAGGSKVYEESATEQIFRLTTKAILNGEWKFPSLYKRAFQFYHTAADNPLLRNPVSKEICNLTSTCIVRFTTSLRPPPLSFRPRTGVRLLDSIPYWEFNFFVNFVRRTQDDINFGISKRRNDDMNDLVVDSCAVGLLEWLAKHRSDVLHARGLLV
ncbi:hypothetical protein BDQ17DRAFT_1371075 [Cyathus striatus]|nr:hypothetical protein BDQ17DRAFT_1371075 [Cyathus striatus]